MADSFDIPALQREALLNHESATEKAAALLLESEVNKMDKGEWRQLIAGVPQDVKRAIVAIMSAVHSPRCSCMYHCQEECFKSPDNV